MIRMFSYSYVKLEDGLNELNKKGYRILEILVDKGYTVICWEPDDLKEKLE